MSSYMNDIVILATSKSNHENCQILQNTANKLINWDQNHHIEFDMKKTELIYFNHTNRLLKESVKIMNNIIKSKEIVRQLDI